MNDERDEWKPHQDLEAANPESSRDGGIGLVATRRQFLKGLTTGTVRLSERCCSRYKRAIFSIGGPLLPC
jgi:hypothetical protein